MIGKVLKWARGRRAPEAVPAPAGPTPAERLAHERAKVAKYKGRLEALQAEHEALALNYQQLRKHLRWHWAAYPGTKGAWLESKDDGELFARRAQILKARLVDLMANPEFAPGDRRVTAVVTSCARHDLLALTLRSFFAMNTHPETRMIVVEDGPQDPDEALKAEFAAQPIRWINTGGRAGQLRAVDLAYSQVETPYIFHMEDDWEFVRPGFMEKSIAVLEAEPMCLQVWIKGKPGKRGHGAEPIDRVSQGVDWRPVIRDRKNFWHGFSFNPGLRRLRDYRLLGRFGDVVESQLGKGAIGEAQLSEIYGSIGFFSAQLWVGDGEPFVMHTGGDRHVA